MTLGDSWGTELKNEEPKGISLILVQSDKGKELLEASSMMLKEVDYEKAVKANHQLNHPSALKPERKVFLQMVTTGSTVKQATNKTLPKEVLKQKIKYILTRTGLLNSGGGYEITVVK